MEKNLSPQNKKSMQIKKMQYTCKVIKLTKALNQVVAYIMKY